MTPGQREAPAPQEDRRPETNTGHGHVWKRPDGQVSRCGGARLCRQCKVDAERWTATVTWTDAAASPVPAVPEEPPDGTMLTGLHGDVWRRDDRSSPHGGSVWRCVGDGEWFTWPGAFEQGADPARRLVVVDPTDEEQVTRVAMAVHATDGGPVDVARAALRAIAGEEQ